MSWTYQYAAQTVSLLDYCTAVTVVDESGGGKVGADLDVAYMDGQRWVEKTYGPMIIPLKTILRYTDKNGLVNHTNGAAGHVYENLHALKLLFEAPGLKYLTRTDPHAGAVRAEFELAGEPVLGEMRHIFIWPLRTLRLVARRLRVVRHRQSADHHHQGDAAHPRPGAGLPRRRDDLIHGGRRDQVRGVGLCGPDVPRHHPERQRRVDRHRQRRQRRLAVCRHHPPGGDAARPCLLDQPHDHRNGDRQVAQ